MTEFFITKVLSMGLFCHIKVHETSIISKLKYIIHSKNLAVWYKNSLKNGWIWIWSFWILRTILFLKLFLWIWYFIESPAKNFSWSDLVEAMPMAYERAPTKHTYRKVLSLNTVPSQLVSQLEYSPYQKLEIFYWVLT